MCEIAVCVMNIKNNLYIFNDSCVEIFYCTVNVQNATTSTKKLQFTSKHSNMSMHTKVVIDEL